MYHKKINFHENYILRENFKTVFFFFSRELIFAKEPTSHILQELNLCEFCKKDILPVAITFCMRLNKGVYQTSQRLDLHDLKT